MFTDSSEKVNDLKYLNHRCRQQNTHIISFFFFLRITQIMNVTFVALAINENLKLQRRLFDICLALCLL